MKKKKFRNAVLAGILVTSLFGCASTGQRMTWRNMYPDKNTNEQLRRDEFECKAMGMQMAGSMGINQSILWGAQAGTFARQCMESRGWFLTPVGILTKEQKEKLKIEE